MTRRHDIDAIRVLAFGLLILYHIGMLYVYDWGWHIKSSYQSEWLQLPMLMSNRWRMSLLFMVSGMALAMSGWEARRWSFFGQRSWRLLVPLLFGMFFWVAIQAYCQGVANGKVRPGFGQFLLDMWSFKPWPEDAFDGWEHGITWNHLWYLAYLWVYTGMLVVLQPLLRSRLGQGFGAMLANLRGITLIFAPVAVFALYNLTLLPRFEATNDLLNDWFQHAQYFTVFLLGFWLARSDTFWAEVLRLRWWLTGAALVVFAIYVPLIYWMPDENPPELPLAIARVLRAVYMWLALLAVMGQGHRYLNRPFRWLPYATEAVFPWYVLHQTLIVVIAYWLVPLQLGPVLEPTLVIVGTVGGCLLLHEYVIRRIALLRPLFGLKWRSRLPARSSAEAPASAT